MCAYFRGRNLADALQIKRNDATRSETVLCAVLRVFVCRAAHKQGDTTPREHAIRYPQSCSRLTCGTTISIAESIVELIVWHCVRSECCRRQNASSYIHMQIHMLR